MPRSTRGQIFFRDRAGRRGHGPGTKDAVDSDGQAARLRLITGRRAVIRTLAAIGLAMAVPATAQHTRSLGNGSSPPASIDQLAWLAGSWVGTGMGSDVTETYSAPLGGRITGHFAMADGKGGVSLPNSWTTSRSGDRWPIGFVTSARI